MTKRQSAGAKDLPHDEIGQVASGFASVMVGQVATRGLTFALSLLIARSLNPEAYGLATVQFHLIMTIILLLGREGFRRGCLRYGTTSTKGRSTNPLQVLSIAWLPIPIGIVLALLTCTGALMLQKADAVQVPGYSLAIVLHGVAAVIELLSEPFFILASINLHFRVRVAVEAACTIVRSLTTLALVGSGLLPPALAFAGAQLSLALVTVIGYGWYGVHTLRQAGALPRLWPWGPTEHQALRMSALFELQSVEKMLLAEGSKVLLVAFNSRVDQGVYGLVSNLGSLVVRTLFAPLEEVAFTAFSRFQSRASDPMGLAKLGNALSVLVKATSLLGLLSAVFGPAYSYTVLRLVYGSTWAETDAPRVLAFYSVYILFVAVNGITEAFVQAVQDGPALRQYNILLIIFTAAHVAVSALLISSYGVAGLVTADAVNMALRISYSLWYIHCFFKPAPDFRIMQMLPSRTTFVTALGCGSAALLSSHCLLHGRSSGVNDGVDFAMLSNSGFAAHALPHIAVGGGLLAALLAVIFRTEQGTLAQVAALRQQRTLPNLAQVGSDAKGMKSE